LARGSTLIPPSSLAVRARPKSARDRLIVALDFSDLAQARRMADLLAGHVGVFKVGLELAHAGGLTLAQDLLSLGHPVFLDLKLHDISNTVERAVAQIARLGVTFLTIHAYPQTLKAAAAGARGSPLALLGVSALTSYSDEDLKEAGYRFGVADLVRLRAQQAREAGVSGLILSAHEAAEIRTLVGPDLLLITPGVRPAGAERGDQKRVATPAAAIRAGADYLVVGRPILQASEPAKAAAAIVEEIARALEQTGAAK
jgi:orotidine-5'-phosphate decarboxylase